MPATLTIDAIPQDSQETLEWACKSLEWADQEVTADNVEQYLIKELWYRPYVVKSLIAVFVNHWNSPIETEVAS